MKALKPVDVLEARVAVAAMGARASAMLRSVSNPSARALGTWSVCDVAIHLSHVLDLATSLARGSASMTTDIWDLATLTTTLVAGEAERDLGAIATRIDASVAALTTVLREERGEDDDPSRTWLVEGVELPMSSIACHALNEIVVHGHDIARADGQPWAMERAHASLVLRGFLFPVLAGLGRSMLDSNGAAGTDVTYQLHLRGGGGVCMRICDGDLTVSDAPQGPVDCHLLVDPMAFLLVSWGRTSQWAPIMRGKLLAYGRKPWLGLRLRSMLRNP